MRFPKPLLGTLLFTLALSVLACGERERGPHPEFSPTRDPNLSSESGYGQIPTTYVEGTPNRENRLKAVRHYQPELEWLARNQSERGCWHVDPSAPGSPDDPPSDGDLQTTAAALIAFSNDGQTHKTGHFSQHVRAAMIWLIQGLQERERNCFRAGSGDSITHMMVTCAFCEIYSLSLDMRLKRHAEGLLRTLLNSQLGSGAFPSTLSNGESATLALPSLDASAMAAITLLSASIGGILDLEEAREKLRAYGRQFNPHTCEARDAASLHALETIHWDFLKAPEREQILATRLKQSPFNWTNPESDWLSALFTTHEHKRGRDSDFQAWTKAVWRPQILDQQRGYSPLDKHLLGEAVKHDDREVIIELLPEFGSWDARPGQAWEGSRSYATAMAGWINGMVGVRQRGYVPIDSD